MSGNIYTIFAIFIILILSLGTILYNTHIFKQDIEGFQGFQGFNQIEMFQNIEHKSTHPVIYPQTDTYKEDDSMPLKKYHYIKESAVHNLEHDLPELFFTTYLQFYSMSINDIHQKIADDLNKVALKSKGEFVEGPVYVIVCKDNKDCYSDDLIDVGTKEKLTSIYILYPRYYSDDNGKIIAYPNKKGMSEFKSYFDNIVTTDMLGNNAIVYQLNNKNKLFYNLMS